MLEEERFWLERIISIILILLSTHSCSSISSVVSMVGNAGISSKGFKSSLNDSYIKTKIVTNISMLDIDNLTNVAVNISQGKVLLTGYIDNYDERLEIVRNVWNVDGVKEIINELKINNTVSLSDRTSDFMLKTKINTQLLFKSGINSNNYNVDVVDGEVYIIGFAENLDEKIEVEKLLSNLGGISKLVSVIDIPKNVKTDR